ncbi:MAG: copper-binding protein [Acidobacteriota bacterium]
MVNRRHWLALIPVFGMACSTRREPKFDYGEPKQRYQLRGRVLRLRPEARIASIAHEKIEGWMEAMTMEFPVPKEADFARLKEGAVIRATVNVNDLNYWLTDIVVE